jgi:hypothetical protein
LSRLLPALLRAALLGSALAGVAACGSESGSQGGASAATLADAPLEVEEARLILEPVRFGDSRTARYQLRNPSDEAVVLDRVGPASCSCTSLTLHFPQRADAAPIDLTGTQQEIEIQPNEAFEIEVLFDTSRLRRPVSRRTDSFAVMVRGARGMILEYAIDVWTPFWVEPWSVDLDRVGVRERAQGFVSVRAHDADQGFELIVPESVDGWTTNIKTFEGGGADFAVEFTAPEELPLGPFDVRIPIRADLPDSPTLTVSVRGVAVPDLDINPKRVTLIPDASGKAQEEVQLISRNPARALGLRAVVVEGLPPEVSAHLATSTEILAPEKAFLIRLDLRQAPSERVEGRLVLVTDDPDQPRIDLPLVLRPRP